MTTETFLKDRVDTLFGTNFEQRDGRVVPATGDVVLKNGAVKIEAAFLYSDLAGSAKLSKSCPWSTTAKIIRAFLDCSSRLIIKHGGHVRSFDGDRVMGVFIGDSKNSNGLWIFMVSQLKVLIMMIPEQCLAQHIFAP